MVDSFAGSELPEDLIFFVVQIFRNEPQHRAANDLLRGIAEHPIGSLIPALDHSIQIFADDGVIRGIDDGSKTKLAVINSTAITNIPSDLRCTYHSACAIPYGRNRNRDGELLAIFSHSYGFIMVDSFSGPQFS